MQADSATTTPTPTPTPTSASASTTTSAAAAAASSAIPESESSESEPLILEGSCFCRSVSWRVKGEPLISIYCHCTICQRMNGSAFVHGLHFPLTSFSWTNNPTNPNSPNSPPTTPSTTLTTHSSPNHPWTLHHCKSCHAYIGATNSLTQIWSLKSAHLARDPTTKLIKGFERIKPTAHIFYGTRMLDVQDGLPKWEGYEGRSRRLDLP